MKRLLIIILCGLGCLTGVAQTTINENTPVQSQEKLTLDFPFTNEIIIKNWDKNEVSVKAVVSINDGKDDNIFAMKKEISSSSIRIYMNDEAWKNKDKKQHNWNTEIYITVYVPNSLAVKANTISGDILAEYFGRSLDLITISGDIDLTIDDNEGLDFKAKTISGDIFSDLTIEFPDGREGHRKIVGMDVNGRVRSGGEVSKFQTISGNVFLRKG